VSLKTSKLLRSPKAVLAMAGVEALAANAIARAPNHAAFEKARRWNPPFRAHGSG
jgi:hypothetical protein